MIDSDVVFRDYNQSLRDLMNNKTEFVNLKDDSSIIVKGHHCTELGICMCTALIFFQNRLASKEILNFWWNCAGKNCSDYYFRHPFEQEYFAFNVSKTFPNDIGYMRDDSYDWTADNFFRHVHWMHGLKKRVDYFNETLIRTIKFKEMEDKEAVNISEIVQIIQSEHTIQMYDKQIYHDGKHIDPYYVLQ